MFVNDFASDNTISIEDNRNDRARCYGRDFWSEENLKFIQPHYRLEKAAQIVRGIAKDKESMLLDVGCGPATLKQLLPPNIHYYGIDMALHDPTPNLLEADLLKTPIRFEDKRFDIILAQGVFEYFGNMESQKFAEIAKILADGGKFVVTYWNYSHRNTKIYFAHTNVRPVEEFRRDLSHHFDIDTFFPASHNWYHGSPSLKLNKLINMRVNKYIPFLSPIFAVEYFFICSARREDASRRSV
jgi:SAM-dependent methyltransferase